MTDTTLSKDLAAMVAKCGGETVVINYCRICGYEKCRCNRPPPLVPVPKPTAELLAWLEGKLQQIKSTKKQYTSYTVHWNSDWEGYEAAWHFNIRGVCETLICLGTAKNKDRQTACILAALEAATKTKLWENG